MEKRSSFLTNISQLRLFIIGIILTIAGGLTYIALQPNLIAIALILLILGITIFFQSSRAFQVDDFSFLFVVFFSIILLTGIDFWSVQVAYSTAASNNLQLFGIASFQVLNPHYGGMQVLLFVQEAGTGRFVGGEIDNACAGLIVLIPCILLLCLTDKEHLPLPNRIVVGSVSLGIIIIGNFARIFFELWAPAVGLAPFEIVHYPPAFILGLLGLIVIIIFSQRMVNSLS